MNFNRLFLLCALIFAFGVTSSFACRAPKPSPTKLVEDAEFIVRARADKYIREPSDLNSTKTLKILGNEEINFKVEEVLKGDFALNELVLNGSLTDKDDFNDREAPYDFVRPNGRGGSCSAYEYKKDAEFLLFLKKVNGKLTIRWYALAPTNEQLHSKDDRWITWVRNYLKTSEN